MMSRGRMGSITIHARAKSGDLRSVKRLLHHKPSLLNKRSIRTLETPLHTSAKHNRIEVMKYLLYESNGKEELELEAKNALCETPLHVAAKNGCEDALRMLLESGANIEARTNNYMTPLHLAVVYALQSGNNSTVKALLENSADLAAADEEGMIPIDYLPENPLNCELVALLDQGDVETRDQDGNYDGAKVEDDHIQKDWNGIKYDDSNRKRYLNNDDNRNEDGEDKSHEIKAKDHDGQNNCDGTKDDDDARQSNSEVTDNSSIGYTGNDELEEELEKIVGLRNLKMQLRRWAKGMILDEKRPTNGLDLGPRRRPHMAFLGNPGTGKTTVARIMGKLLHSTGVLSGQNVTEVQRTDIWSIKEAKGGILFVDEAYSLSSQAGSKDYGMQALEEIMSVLEDDDIVVIFEGYTEPMKHMLASNPGFYRRVTHILQFDEFSCKDLTEMLMLKMSKQDMNSPLYGFKLHASCDYESILAVIEIKSSQELRGKMNGGLVDHMLNNARENLDSRLSMESQGDELFTITLGDLEAGLRVLAKRTKVDSRTTDDIKYQI